MVCAACGGKRRIIAKNKEGAVTRKILAHLGLPTSAPKPGQRGVFPTGPPAAYEPEPSVWSDEDYDQRLTESEFFA
jgi:hypothetical protein